MNEKFRNALDKLLVAHPSFESEAEELERQYHQGLITHHEYYNKLIDVVYRAWAGRDIPPENPDLFGELMRAYPYLNFPTVHFTPNPFKIGKEVDGYFVVNLPYPRKWVTKYNGLRYRYISLGNMYTNHAVIAAIIKASRCKAAMVNNRCIVNTDKDDEDIHALSHLIMQIDFNIQDKHRDLNARRSKKHAATGVSG